ncbi:MAG: helix-turn-helix domain-containing protein [Bacillus sp. (in: firmicutes)]
MRRNIHLIRTIGNELRSLRKAKNLHVKDIAEDVGVSSTYISEIERNNKVPSNELIEKMAQTYNVDEKRLYKGFNIIPESVIFELTSTYGLYDLFYELSEDESITREEKDEFYQKVKELYKDTFKKR